MVLKESKWCLPKPPLPPEGRNNHPEVEAKSLSSRLPSWGLWAFWRRTIQCNSFQSTIPHQPRGNSETIREKLRGKVKERERERELIDPSWILIQEGGRKEREVYYMTDTKSFSLLALSTPSTPPTLYQYSFCLDFFLFWYEFLLGEANERVKCLLQVCERCLYAQRWVFPWAWTWGCVPRGWSSFGAKKKGQNVSCLWVFICLVALPSLALSLTHYPVDTLES